MITINAAFTLPGLAGLVLTVGMSVDANVLIFERIREEITKGSALRMAIRNGFGRATTTIVDANVTTLITAIVLYAIGTDQIRGFAVTLILGILMSMFTAIFCSRIIFDLAEKSRRLSLNMSQLVGATQFDFIGKRQLAAIFSIVLIAAGIAGLTLRGADIFDIDFRGGTSVQLILNKEMETDEVRASLGPKFSKMGVRYTLSAMNSGGSDTNSVFKVDSAIAEVGDLQMAIQEALKQPDGKSLLATYSLDVVEMRTVAMVTPETRDESKTDTSTGGTTTDAETDVSPPDTTPADQNPAEDAVPAAESAAQPAKEAEGPKPAAETSPPSSDPAASAPSKEPTTAADPTPSADGIPGAGAPPTPAAGETPAPSGAPAPDDGARFSRSTDTDNLLAMADDLATLIAQAEPDAKPKEAATTETTASQPPATEASPTTTTSPPTDEEKPAAAKDEPSATTPTGGEEAAADPTLVASSQVEVDLAFEHAINKDTLSSMITTAMDERGQTVFFELFNADYDRGSNAFKTWRLQIPGASEAQTQQLLDQLQAQFADKPVWQSSNKIGGQVAGKMQRTAILALLTSLLGIILYIWIRFQRVIFGLAAVVALVHDVLVTLGAIALSYWLAGVFGFLLIEEFKISLPIVAALLTIIGYSLNDTIVVFDRIREVRGKSPDLTGDMINRSINQTLGRTILTSFTTLIVVLILYFIGGDGIHGFAFALVVGVTVGTYSSIFVASPALLWMTGANKSRQRSKAA
jgi:SecD/SecF fusion protein